MTAIRTPDQRLRVFVSSTMKELATERAAARAAIEGLRLIPVMFELGARPYPPRDLYLAYLRQSDVFVGIYGQQYGWTAPDQEISGLEDEYIAASGKPKLVYVQAAGPERDSRLVEMLRHIQSDGLSYRTFAQAEELSTLIADDLAVLLSERFDQESESPDSGSWPRRQHLPVPVSRFVGRNRELQQLQDLVTDSAVRLVTLVGPGGIGKTRLALETAAVARPDFDGVAMVQLEEVSSADLITSVIASSLGVPETSTRPLLGTLIEFLGSRPVLLVVDNFEHVMAGATILAELLKHTTHLTLLVTSRERLHLSGERIFDVPPLVLPDEHAYGDAALQSDSVQLFVDRARATGAQLDLDGNQLSTIVQICRRLEGLPLAIELAAARASMLGPDELLRRLERRLAILTGGPHDLPARQQALRSTITWSYDLLDDHDQRLFARLGVFAAGFSLQAAEAVCADEAVPDVLDVLASLVDKSLVRTEDALHGQPRFTMLQIVREFAAEKLEVAGELDRLRDRHADFFEQRAIADAAGVRRGDAKKIIEQYLADQANVRLAMAWLLESQSNGRVARVGLAMWPVWWIRSLFIEGIETMERVLADEQSLTEQDRAHARLVLGLLAFGQGDYDRAAPSLRLAADLYGKLSDRLGSATATVPLGVISAVRSRNDGEDMLERAVVEFRSLDDRWGLTFALFCLGGALVLHERHADAVAPLKESVELARVIETDVLLSNALVNLGWAYLGLGDIAAAGRVLTEALAAGIDLDNRESVARALEALAAAAVFRGDTEHGATLFGAAEGVRRSMGVPVWMTDRASHEQTQDRLRARLGDLTYNAVIAGGAALGVEEVLEVASRS
jgi:predicted ATPase